MEELGEPRTLLSRRWSLFFLLEGIQGHSYGDYVAFQVLTVGLACLGTSAMLFASGAFLCVRGWRLLRRHWPGFARIEFDPIATRALASRNWIGFAAAALVTIPPYFMIWGPLNWSTLGPTVAYYDNSIAQVKTPGEAAGSQPPEASWLSPKTHSSPPASTSPASIDENQAQWASSQTYSYT